MRHARFAWRDTGLEIWLLSIADGGSQSRSGKCPIGCRVGSPKSALGSRGLGRWQQVRFGDGATQSPASIRFTHFTPYEDRLRGAFDSILGPKVLNIVDEQKLMKDNKAVLMRRVPRDTGPLTRAAAHICRALVSFRHERIRV